jgi:hypothetical protein
MVFEAPPLHEFVNKKAMIIFNAKADELDEIRVMELAKKGELGLRLRSIRTEEFSLKKGTPATQER